MSRGSTGPRWLNWIIAGLLLLLVTTFMEQALFAGSGQMLGGHDIVGLFYPWLFSVRQSLDHAQLPLWTPYIFGGYPFLSDPQVGFFYPPTWLAILLPVDVGLDLYVVLHLWLAGFGMWLLMRRLNGSWLAATLAALSFTFSGFAAARIEAGHIGLLATHAWLPWMLVATAWSIECGDVWSGALAGLPFGLAILAGNTPSLIYMGVIWLAFTIYLVVTQKRILPAIRQVVIGVVVGLSLSAIQLIPLIEFSTLSTRAGATLEEFGSRWSFPPFHLVTLFIPNYFGEPVQTGYWSVPDFEELTYYVGALPLLAIPLALRKPSRLGWFYIGLMVFGLLTALGTYGFLYPVLYRLLPPLRMVRGPARAAFLFVFGACALLGEVIAIWEKMPLEERSLKLRQLMRWMLPVIAIVGVIGLAATGATFTVFHPSETGGRLWHQAGGWAWGLVVFLSGGGLLWHYLTVRAENSRSRIVAALMLAMLVITDLWFFGFKLIVTQPAAPDPLWADARNVIGDTPQRVVPWAVGVYIQNHAEIVGLRSVLGIDPLEIAAYHNFAVGMDDPRSTVYDILGVAYVLSPGPLGTEFTEGERPIQLIANTSAVWVYRRARVLHVARMTYQVEVNPDSSAAIARIHEPGFDPATTVILSAQPPCQIGSAPDIPGAAQIVEQRPGYWLIDTESASPGLLVVSETAYPGWQVTVDGKKAEPLTAYSVIRAVCVPAGSHRVEWVFDPVSLKVGAAVTFFALLACGVAGRMVWRRRNP